MVAQTRFVIQPDEPEALNHRSLPSEVLQPSALAAVNRVRLQAPGSSLMNCLMLPTDFLMFCVPPVKVPCPFSHAFRNVFL